MPRPPKLRHLMAEDHVAQNLRLGREARGWSAARLADLMTSAGCAIDQSAIHKIEKQGRRITVNELVGIGKTFEMTLEQLIGDPTFIADQEVANTIQALVDLDDREQRLVVESQARRQRLLEQLASLSRVSPGAQAAVDLYVTYGSAEGQQSATVEVKSDKASQSGSRGRRSR